ncbi:MAG: NAD(P)/FAD-dependent oxidoreductase [Lachnospiraceae bacterium]|jgi:glycine/D-amino acid oxidase-like deaminating enzyme
MKRADAVVIGGGIIGCSTAYYLAREGLHPVVIERNGIGEGTSGACDGFIMLQTKKPGLPLRMAMSSAKLYAGLTEELGYDIQYRRPGGLVLIETEEMKKIMEGVVAKQIREGMEVEFIGNQKIRELEPLVSEKIPAAVYSDLDGDVSPIYTTRAFARKAADLGAEILTHTPVTGVHIENGEVAGVLTPDGEIRTETVVNCAGVWSPAVGAMMGTPIPVKPRRGHLVVSEAVARVLRHEITDARYIAIKHDPDMVKRTLDPTFKLGISLSMEQTENGNFLIGSAREFAGYDTDCRFDIIRGICEYSTRFFPALRNLNIIRTFVGMRPYCEDGVPIISPVSTIQGAYIATGTEGDGIALAPITGRTIMEMILHRETEFDMTPFSYDRFVK